MSYLEILAATVRAVAALGAAVAFIFACAVAVTLKRGWLIAPALAAVVVFGVPAVGLVWQWAAQ